MTKIKQIEVWKKEFESKFALKHQFSSLVVHGEPLEVWDFIESLLLKVQQEERERVLEEVDTQVDNILLGFNHKETIGVIYRDVSRLKNYLSQLKEKNNK